MARMRLCALVMALIVTACSSEPQNSSPDTTNPSVPTVNDWATTLTWKECGSGIDCSSVEVPFDYSKPDLGSFILPVARHRATQPASRIGTLLVNPGGPGSAATDWASYAVQVLSSSIVERFDIVAWDEFRGSLEQAVTMSAITSAQSLIRVISNLRGSLHPYAYGTSHDDAE